MGLESFKHKSLFAVLQRTGNDLENAALKMDNPSALYFYYTCACSLPVGVCRDFLFEEIPGSRSSDSGTLWEQKDTLGIRDSSALRNAAPPV